MGDSAATAGGDALAQERAFANDWASIRADADLQFMPLEIPPPAEPPAWWQAFVEWLGEVLIPLGRALAQAARAIGVSAQLLTWAVVAVGGALAVFLLWRTLGPRMRRRREPGESPSWTPQPAQALALLEQADRLAAEGRFEEATHLLLRRSVEHIAAARPELLEPSTTAREIASLSALSTAARAAFGTISERVERSLFALRRLTAEDWHAARAAYADFALAAPEPARA